MASFGDLAEACDEQLASLRANTKAIGGANRDAGRAANADATKAIREIERALKQMESEARAAAPTARRPLLETIAKVRGWTLRGREAAAELPASWIQPPLPRTPDSLNADKD